jgi:rod shape determining protein RodA
MTRRALRQMDWGLVAAVLGLIVTGLVLVHSASQVPALPGRSALFARQLTWAGFSMIVLLITAVIPFRVWEEYSPFFYGLSLLLLLAVPLFGVERLGARRWLMMGGVQFQPSELAKLATLLYVSRLLAKPRLELTRLPDLLPVVTAAFIPFLLILLEPDLGTSLSVPASIGPMAYWAGLPAGVVLALLAPLVSAILSVNLWLWLIFLAGVTTVLVFTHARRWVMITVLAMNIAVGTLTPLLWNSLKPYQRQRVVTFLNPDQDQAGAGYQVIQSKIAIGSGGLTGTGLGEGTQKGLAFLPQQHTDFIFSVLGEEKGFLGCLFVLLLFAFVVQRSLRLAVRARSRFGSVLVIGICSNLVFHVVVNVSMTLGLAPVTGLPLPFLSYGGTFLVATLAQMGLLFNVAFRRNEV